jgi:putative transposase
MKFDPQRHHRHSLRLKGYDYSLAGGYFVTCVTESRARIFGVVVGGESRLNEAGEMVRAAWLALPERFPSIEMDAFVVMPDHFHGIVLIHDKSVRAGLVPDPSEAGTSPAQTNSVPTRVAPTLGEIIGAFKSITTVENIHGVEALKWPSFPKRLWMRNYYEHIIHSEAEGDRIYAYIETNPLRRVEDEEDPDRWSETGIQICCFFAKRKPMTACSPVVEPFPFSLRSPTLRYNK